MIFALVKKRPGFLSLGEVAEEGDTVLLDPDFLRKAINNSSVTDP